MLQTGIAVYTENDWYLGIPYIYSEENGWQPYIVFIRENETWKIAHGSGALMIKFITSDGNEFMTSDGEYFLVRQAEDTTQRLVTNNNKLFKTSDGKVFRVKLV